MSFRKYFRELLAALKSGGKRGRVSDTRRDLLRSQLGLECLEARVVPAVIFNPVFGFEALSLTPKGDFNYTTISNANVDLIFWGKFWGTAAGTSQVKLLTNEVKGMIGSGYLGYLTQYGSNGIANLQRQPFVDSSSDPLAGYSAGSASSGQALTAEITSAINNPKSPIPPPASNATITTAPIYVVIVDPSHSDTNGGYNVPGTYNLSNGNAVPINMISIGTNFTTTSKGIPTTTIRPDYFSLTFSHELAERMSDPTGNSYGVGVSPGGLLPQNVVGGSQLGQIADYEPEPSGQAHYGYRVSGQNGILIQPYWSNTDHAFVVADGTKESLILTPKWTVTSVNPNLPPVPSNQTGTFSGNYSLLIKGDQFRQGFADSIVINATATGTQITLNGEKFYFDAGRLTDINVYSGSGNDKIDVEATTAGLPVFIDTGAGDDDVIISRDAKLFTNVAGNVTVVGYNTDNDRLTINDQADPATNPSFKVTSSTVQQTGAVMPGIGVLNSGLIRYNGIFRGGVIVSGGTGGSIFTVESTHAFPTTLNTGTGPDNVYVHGTTGSLTVNGQGGSDNVTVGINRSVAAIGGGLTVTNSGGSSAVSVDDSADKNSRTVILYNNGTYNVLSGFPTGGDILLKGGQLRSLAISAGSSVVNGAIVGGNTFRIHDTPNNSTPGGVTTTINTGPGPDNVTIDGTTGVLALDVQGSGPGANAISVGSATANLDGIRGPINITGLAGAESDLSVIDSASTTSHQFVIDRDFVQRGGRARIGYQNMSQLTVRTAAQPDHIIVQNTFPFASGRSTSIPLSGGNDVIDVLETTGTLLIDAGGTSSINVGSAASSLDNIQGLISLAPQGAGNHVRLSLDDEAATTPQRLDITTQLQGFVGRSFQRSGAAVINELFSPLYSFQWHSGSGGTDVHEYVKAAQLTNFILGNDVLTIGTKAGATSDFGPITVTGGVGPDAVILDDSGETRAQTYSVSQASGHELFTTRGTTVDLGPDIETFEVKGGKGGNVFNVSGTIAGMTTILHAGARVNTVNVGGTGSRLQGIQGPVTLDGVGGTSTLTFNDQGTTTVEYYYFTTDELTRRDANYVPDMAPISLAGFKAVTLNMGSGGDIVNVFGSAAGSSVTVNGQAGSLDTFVVQAYPNAILGPVVFNGQSADGDYAVYYDSENTAAHTYTLTSNSIGRDDLAPMVFSGLSLVLLNTPLVSGSTVNVNSASPNSFLGINVANGVQVTIGSLAPGLGGALANILSDVSVASYTPNDAVSLILDDSSDLTSKNATFTPGQGLLDYARVEGFGPSTVFWNLGANSSVTLLGGQGGLNGLTFDDQSTTTRENYSLTVDQLRRVEANGFFDDMTPLSFTGFEAMTLNVCSGGSAAAVYGSLAGSTVTVNGYAGSPDDFAVDASANAIQGPIFLNGQSAEGDFAQYYDIGNAAPHTYTLTSASISRDGQAAVFSNVGAIVYAPTVGGNTFNVNSVALGGAYKIVAADGDHVTVGSLAPGLGGTLGDILDQVNVVSAADDAVALVFDDSGNTDTTAKHVTFSAFDADGNVSMLGLTPIAVSWNLPLASAVTVLGGAADETFSIQPFLAVTPLRIDGGGGVNTLDYSGYVVTADSLPGLVSWYKGEGNFTDSFSGNDGTPQNGVAFGPGKIGQAFNFNGVDGFVEIPDSPKQAPDSITIQAWVDPNDLSGLRSIMSKYQSSDPGPDNVSWFLGNIDGHIEFGVYQSGQGRVIETDDAVLTAGDWQHVAGTFDVATQAIKIYLNGVEVASSFVPGHDFTLTGIGDSNSPVRIGSLSDSNGDLNGFWDGLIDEPAFYSRALNAGEIQSLASAAGAGTSNGVVVNLPLGTATGLAGGIANIQNVIGSAGNDILVGNGGNVLDGGLGRDLLIAGASASTLFGGGEDDILIAGTTNYDHDPAALMAILSEWTSAGDYASRVADLMNGTNGVPILNADTVHSDGGGNTLNGDTGLDFFFANLELDTLDRDPLGEVFVAV